MTEFWEANFREKQSMWGFEPAASAVDAVDLFLRQGLHKILIPGYGYGRNAKAFTEWGLDVTGIEISKTAIDLAKNHLGDGIKVHHGSVEDMPFDDQKYDGIYCHALIHLLDGMARTKLIADCNHQLRLGGLMFFVAISTRDPSYGEGKWLSKNRFLTPHGVNLFFYDMDSISTDFGKYGLVESKEIEETIMKMAGGSSRIFWQIVCEKSA